MLKARAIIGGGLLVGLGLLLGACGEPEDLESTYRPVTPGDQHAIVLRGALDRGILRDPSGYQPTEIPGLEGEAARGVTRASGISTGESGMQARPTGGADAESRIEQLVTDLTNAMSDGEAELALRLYQSEHVDVLLDGPVDALYETLSRVHDLRLALQSAFDEDKAAELLAVLHGTAEQEAEVELLDADHATAKPNVGLLLLGPELTDRTMKLVRTDTGWKVDLGEPLTGQQAGQVQIYHDGLQVALDEITKWVQSGKDVGEEGLRDVLVAAREGEPVDIEGISAGAEPTEQRQDSRTRGGGRMRRMP